MGMSQKGSRSFLNYTSNTLILIISVGTAISLLIYILLARNINYSLKKIIFGLDEINKGNFETRINLRGKDEFSLISDNINKTVRKMPN